MSMLSSTVAATCESMTQFPTDGNRSRCDLDWVQNPQCIRGLFDTCVIAHWRHDQLTTLRGTAVGTVLSNHLFSEGRNIT